MSSCNSNVWRVPYTAPSDKKWWGFCTTANVANTSIPAIAPGASGAPGGNAAGVQIFQIPMGVPGSVAEDNLLVDVTISGFWPNVLILGFKTSDTLQADVNQVIQLGCRSDLIHNRDSGASGTIYSSYEGYTVMLPITTGTTQMDHTFRFAVPQKTYLNMFVFNMTTNSTTNTFVWSVSFKNLFDVVRDKIMEVNGLPVDLHNVSTTDIVSVNVEQVNATDVGSSLPVDIRHTNGNGLVNNDVPVSIRSIGFTAPDQTYTLAPGPLPTSIDPDSFGDGSMPVVIKQIPLPVTVTY